ncbi:MAG: AAA family ATPase, partial [Lachnospiraceae bacterium]|nr:AAA family ATPase [Lachnospiraceae bacterium]
PGKQFTQTDVLQAYEQFDSWCINKNIFKAYNFDANDGFYLDRSAAKEPPYERLQGLIGLEIVKKQIDTIIAADLVEKERKKRLGNDYKTSCMHMIFAGDPGTAKTTVAKLFAGIAKEKEILKSGAFVERGGMDLNGPFCVDMIRQAFEAARGGVLFIDEAYSLKQDVAVATLIQEMENKRDEVIVILAGYGERMERFLQLNEGLKSRIPNWIDFPNYSTDELTDIFSYIAHDRGFEATPEALEEARCIFEKKRLVDNFGNGRYVRNLFERATKNQAGRLLANGKTADKLKKDELFLLTKDDISCLEEDMLSEQPAGWAKKELEDMIGLTSAKKVIRKAIANFKMNKRYLEMDLTADRASLHMVFTGNPGTAKTTVARLFAQMLRDEKVLPTGQFVEVGRGDLISDHVGGTAPLVKEKFREAQGGVLFIDEAYSLCDDRKNSFGDEAISTIVQEMENNRDKVIVIFAGYPEPMKEFLDRNPGMSSRIAFRINFDDYSVDELCEITKLMVSKKKMSITDGAMEKLRNAYWKVNKTGDFGNGRFVRKLLEEAQMNLAVRLMDYADSDISQELLTTIEESDIPDATDFSDKPRKLGFGF